MARQSWRSSTGFWFLLTPEVLTVAVLFWSRGGATASLSAQSAPVSEPRWSDPVNLGPVVNSASNEDLPHISKNGLSLYFISNRPAGSFGGFDIWVSQRR